MIKINSYTIFNDNIINMKEASKDDHDPENIVYMTDSQKDVINFDNVKTKYMNDLNLSEEAANSFDALVFDGDNFAFIEFKNGKMKSEKQSVKNKIRDSLLIFNDITDTNISFSRAHIDFILVYNGNKNPLPNQITKQLQEEVSSRVTIGNHFSKKAKKEFILFDLERFQTLYFRKVCTYTVEQFNEYLSNLNT